MISKNGKQIGGARPGAGRKKGKPTKASIARQIRVKHGLENALNKGLLPLDVITCVMRGEPLPNGKHPTDKQYMAARDAAPYMHARLSAAVIRDITNEPVEQIVPLSRLLTLAHEKKAAKASLVEGVVADIIEADAAE